MKLASCPLCGSANVVPFHPSPSIAQVLCKVCGCNVVRATLEEAARAWESRPVQTVEPRDCAPPVVVGKPRRKP